ncbi:hypothetical protein FIV00_03805 [Labrenzia sp. THAF82]|nr:hypothetical protein FIV00_03805 [Labrenzia sp. THAF82]
MILPVRYISSDVRLFQNFFAAVMAGRVVLFLPGNNEELVKGLVSVVLLGGAVAFLSVNGAARFIAGGAAALCFGSPTISSPFIGFGSNHTWPPCLTATRFNTCATSIRSSAC